jgi:hypothetical protein
MTILPFHFDVGLDSSPSTLWGDRGIRYPTWLVLAGVCLVLLGIGCQTSLDLGERRFPCSRDADCLAGYTCRRQPSLEGDKICVPVDVDDASPVDTSRDATTVEDARPRDDSRSADVHDVAVRDVSSEPLDSGEAEDGDVLVKTDTRDGDSSDAEPTGEVGEDAEPMDAAPLGDCRYLGKRDGVCRNADLVSASRLDVRTTVDGGRDRRDAGVCRRPEAYEPPTDSETCDGVDNDCDGVVDEGCNCLFRQTKTGICSSGEIGPKGSCRAPTNYQPSTDDETCDDVDNDCDGIVDEGCECDYDGQVQGVCKDQVRNSSGQCQKPSDYEPSTDSESCDGLDNDCDGYVDEGCPCNYKPSNANWNNKPNDATKGVCTEGTRGPKGQCRTPANYSPIDDEGSKSQQWCDGLDNDCDGVTDELCPCTPPGSTRSCYTGPTGTRGVGICKEGQKRCKSDGGFGPCSDTTPSLEQCDDPSGGSAKDEDCDGVVNEGCRCDYNQISTGVCSSGTIDSNSGTCSPPGAYQPATDSEKCDGQDNDCDGITDEGCQCDYNQTSTGVCSKGSINPNSGACEPPNDFEPNTDDETCDNKDNDCDGNVDEGCPCVYDPSDPNKIDDDASNDAGVCQNQSRNAQGVCIPPSDYSGTDDESASNNCDGVDNDCDGTIDEGCQCNYTNTSDGVCSSGTIDTNGNCTAPNNYDSTDDEASANNCDALDNDCDGSVDEGCGCTYDPADPNKIDDDASNDAGVCPGQSKDGQGNCKEPSDYESSESTCNDGKDNDCDGNVDCYDPNCAGDKAPRGGTCPRPSNYEPNDETTCDGIDNDGDGQVDEGCDDDGDDYCDGSMTLDGSSPECSVAGDCEDNDANINPGAAPNEANPGCYEDQDGDDYGDVYPPRGVDAGIDCDDGNQATNPGASEQPGDEVDQNCDGTEVCYVNQDGDNYRTSSKTRSSNISCTDAGEAKASLPAGDCDDTDPDISPGAASRENTSGCYEDQDGDGYGDIGPPSGVDTGTDCDDGNKAINPGVSTESACGDGVDNDCDGKIDCADPDCSC